MNKKFLIIFLAILIVCLIGVFFLTAGEEGEVNTYYGLGAGESEGNYPMVWYNTFIGVNAGYNNSSGRDNTYIGGYAGYNSIGGRENTLIGSHAGYNINTTCYKNVIIGYRAGYDNYGSDNTIIGSWAGFKANGSDNTFVGRSAGYSSIKGSKNTFIGLRAGASNNGSDNIFIGYLAGHGNDEGNIEDYTGYSNVFVGNEAGYNNTEGSLSILLGYQAGYNSQTGKRNVMIGEKAGYNNSKYGNIFMGSESGVNNNGARNILLGQKVMESNTEGDYNVCIGTFAGQNNVTGNRNVFLGTRAGMNETGSNKLYIANNAERTLIYGDFSENKVGINTTNPQGTLDVNGEIYQRGSQLFADYVFEDNYKLESIEEHADYMWSNRHLKAVPKASKDKDGYEVVNVGSHRRGIVEELEKAHIYIDQLNNINKKQDEYIKTLEDRLSKLEELLQNK